ncbi:MAG: hypothetical protein JSS32_08570 [Verrucomicrobia bacterium]|nr:hypothetical protein [Verrucomicrobiota bacterium]
MLKSVQDSKSFLPSVTLVNGKYFNVACDSKEKATEFFVAMIDQIQKNYGQKPNGVSVQVPFSNDLTVGWEEEAGMASKQDVSKMIEKVLANMRTQAELPIRFDAMRLN